MASSQPPQLTTAGLGAFDCLEQAAAEAHPLTDDGALKGLRNQGSPCALTRHTASCRDLKTSNVLLTAEGVAKISDVRVATGLLGEAGLSDARSFSYIPARPPDGHDAPATVSCPSQLPCECHERGCDRQEESA